MSAYRQLLVAIDLGEQSRAVAEKSAELARLWQAKLQLLHVIEFVPVEPMSDALVPVVQIDDRLIARAGEQLQALAVAVRLEGSSCRLAIGSVKGELLRHARECRA